MIRTFLFYICAIGVVGCAIAGLATHSLLTSIFLFFAAILCFSIWKLSFFPPLDESDDEEPTNMISLVGLFKGLPFLNELVLTDHASRAWGIEFESGSDATTFVAGNAPLFVIKTPERMYTINYFSRQYFDNIDEVIEEVTEVRTQHVLESHDSWLSVDLLSEASPENIQHEYALIGALLNEIVNEDCLGVLVPQLMRLVPWDASVSAALTSFDPLAALAPSNPPVVPIEDDDPQLVEAVSKARDSWPKFVAAFEKFSRNEDRDEGRNFSVKAPMTSNGNTEFIWVSVTAIENGIIYGALGNEPVSLDGLHEGDRVRTSVGALNDWVYTDGSDVVGGFTIKVLNEWANRFKSKS